MNVAEFKTGVEYSAWLKHVGNSVKIINVSRGADESYAVTYARRIPNGTRVAIVILLCLLVGLIALGVWATIDAIQRHARLAKLDTDCFIPQLHKWDFPIVTQGFDCPPLQSQLIGQWLEKHALAPSILSRIDDPFQLWPVAVGVAACLDLPHSVSSKSFLLLPLLQPLLAIYGNNPL